MSAFSEPPADPRVTVVIPNHNGVGWLPGCLDALAEQRFRDFDVILVDNGSTDASVAWTRASHPQVRCLECERNSGFAMAANRGVEAARGTYVALLNNDTKARPEWLGSLVRALDESPSEVAAIASKMLSMENPEVLDDVGNALSWFGAAEKQGHGKPAGEFTEVEEVFSPSAGATLYRRDFLRELEGFDERFFSYLEDVDLGLRGRLLGYRYLLEPAAEVLHQGHGTGISRSSYVRLMTRNRVLLFAKSIPFPELVRNLPRLLYGQIYFLVAYHKPLQSLLGYLALTGCLGHILQRRRVMAKARRIGRHEIERLISREPLDPPFTQLIGGWIRGSRG